MRRVIIGTVGAVGFTAGFALTCWRWSIGVGGGAALVAIVAGCFAVLLLARRLIDVFNAQRPASQYQEACAKLRKKKRSPGPSLAHMRDLLKLADNAYDLQFRFRPLLIDVVSDLLALHAQIDFRCEPERARSMIGPVLWEVIRPDRPVANSSFSSPGLGRDRLNLLIDDLERISR